jgi:hypothetical protein
MFPGSVAKTWRWSVIRLGVAEAAFTERRVLGFSSPPKSARSGLTVAAGRIP